MKSRMACFAGPSFHEARGTTPSAAALEAAARKAGRAGRAASAPSTKRRLRRSEGRGGMIGLRFNQPRRWRLCELLHSAPERVTLRCGQFRLGASVSVLNPSYGEMALAGVVLGVLSGIDVKPRAKAPMAELRRRTVGCDGARITYAIFIRVRRDVRHFLSLP